MLVRWHSSACRMRTRTLARCASTLIRRRRRWPVTPKTTATNGTARPARSAQRRIGLAEPASDGSLARLGGGRNREQIGEDLLTMLSEEPRSVVGLDFAFSFPSGYLDELGVTTAAALWAMLAEHGEAWLRAC